MCDHVQRRREDSRCGEPGSSGCLADECGAEPEQRDAGVFDGRKSEESPHLVLGDRREDSEKCRGDTDEQHHLSPPEGGRAEGDEDQAPEAIEPRDECDRERCRGRPRRRFVACRESRLQRGNADLGGKAGGQQEECGVADVRGGLSGPPRGELKTVSRAVEEAKRGEQRGAADLVECTREIAGDERAGPRAIGACDEVDGHAQCFPGEEEHEPLVDGYDHRERGQQCCVKCRLRPTGGGFQIAERDRHAEQPDQAEEHAAERINSKRAAAHAQPRSEIDRG